MDHTVGYVLLGSAFVPGLMGLLLSLKGLSEVDAAAKQAKEAAKEAASYAKAVTQMAKDSKDVAARDDRLRMADAGATASARLATLNDTLGDVSEALKGLTGKLAPARVCFALATLLVVSSLVAFGLVSASTGSDTGGATTTTSTTTTATP